MIDLNNPHKQQNPLELHRQLRDVLLNVPLSKSIVINILRSQSAEYVEETKPQKPSQLEFDFH